MGLGKMNYAGIMSGLLSLTTRLDHFTMFRSMDLALNIPLLCAKAARDDAGVARTCSDNEELNGRWAVD